ncbi:LOW QUALITY PROTEIN: olfactory receptor 52B2-like [Cynoglossus semilaevis]|uniref:LOW QUALITY PROTEIN: olfactory receptor 52B2-like n=1 Tax=Cynoglossus semilaevis TaxID=244447 RepID=UPI000497C1C2|nr:LOW QUALITY PROTEIN: olfactory receptor 52B2-like [Cynoglossus semilaevis]
MYPNASSLLTLETLGLSGVTIYPAFVFATLTYMLIMFFNLLLLLVIALNKKLHRPMFILLINLPISDMTGATALFPQLLSSMVTQNRQISHSACMAQAFLIHFYGTGNLLILTAMAYDRYVAICSPLKYNAIMTPNKLTSIVIAVWLMNFLLIVTLILLLARFKSCRMTIVDLYCNNPSLLKTVCEDTTVNNIFGLIFIFLLQGGTTVLVIFSYAQILRTCVMSKQTDASRKALQTCGTHLMVFILLQINTLVTLISHRLGGVSPFLRRLLGMSVLLFPPFLDPIIYGLKTSELKQGIKMFMKRIVVAGCRINP